MKELDKRIYAMLVIDQGSGSTPKGSSQTPETMGQTFMIIRTVYTQVCSFFSRQFDSELVSFQSLLRKGVSKCISL